MKNEPLWRRYARLLGPDPAADARDELEFHLESTIEELMAGGLSRAEAEREARRRLGDLKALQQVGSRFGRDRQRAESRREWFSGLKQDLTYAFRTLKRERGFALVTVLILALGIAANTAVFSVVNTVLLRPLPFQDSERLAWLSSGRRSAAEGRKPAGLSDTTYTVDAFEEYQRGTRAFSQLASYNPFLADTDFTLLGRGEPQPLPGVAVSENLFQTLGLRPHLGRFFTHEECLRGGPGAAMLSYSFWKSHLNSDPAVLGQSLTLRVRAGEAPFTVVGVLPESFDFGSVFAPGVRLDIFVPAVMDDHRRRGNTLALVGRLGPGATLAQAQAEADLIWPRIHAAHRDWWGDYTSTLTSLKENVSGRLRRPLLLVWGAVAVMLLIVCVNLSNLLLARGATRGREFALRTALGAGRGRLFAQLLAESALLCTAGAALGLTLAYSLVSLLARQGSIALPLLSSVRLDVAALLWTLGLTTAACLLFGLVPALSTATANIQSTLRDGGHGTTGGRRHDAVRSALVISEVALASLLLIGAGLLLRSFVRVLDSDLGFQPTSASAISITFDDGRQRARRGPVLQAILDKVHQLPGVEAAGIADMLPLGRNRSWGIRGKGQSYPKEVALDAFVRVVSPGYLRAMGIRLVDGRDFAWSDTSTSENVAILNQAAARRFFPDTEALGRIAILGNGDTRVVGIVANVRENSVETAVEPEMYVPISQCSPSGAELVVRSALPPEALQGALMGALRGLNPNQPAASLRPVQEIVDRALSPRRFFLYLVAAFALLGLVLAALGVYGVISYSVTCQRQQIGIRLALGAPTGSVLWSVLARALRLVAAGLCLGIVVAAVSAPALESLLFGTRPHDAFTFAAVPLLLAGVALVAALVPARRAARLDPMQTLRAEG